MLYPKTLRAVIVEIEVIGNVNVIATKKSRAHPNTPWSSHDVPGLGKQFGQGCGYSTKGLARYISNDLALSGVHRKARLYIDLRGVRRLCRRHKMERKGQLEIIRFFHTSAYR